VNLDQCEVAFERALASRTEAEFCDHISPLFSVYKILSVGMRRGDKTFWRARVASVNRWPLLKDMDYPPAEKASVGRLNDAGFPCFYLAGGMETALLEIDSKQGETVQLAAFRIKAEEELRLILVGEYSFVQKMGYVRLTGVDPGGTIGKMLNEMSTEDRTATLYIDRFFANILNDPNARDSGYLMSRALGAFLHARIREADGIAFPSVRDSGGWNYAILPDPSDRAFGNVACVVVRVLRSRLYGFVEFEPVGCADGLGPDDNFIWADPYDPSTITMYGMTKDEFDRKAI